MNRPGWAALVGTLMVLALLPGSARASAEVQERLRGRLDPATIEAVSGVIEQASATGLPTEPLVVKALEGASKGAPGPRIAAVVREYAMALAAARDALGRDAREAEIVAGAGALMAGVSADSIGRLREARPGQSLVVPLVVLADLVARKVPAPTASGTILAASRAGVRDTEFLKLRERVEKDIRAGTSPLTAATMRGRALILGQEGDLDGTRSRPGAPGERR